MSYKIDKEIEESVRKAAESHFKNHSVVRLYGDDGFSDGNIYGVWECSNKGSCFYRFYLSSCPGCLTFYGDLGTLSVSRGQDVLFWAMHYCQSYDYFASKYDKSQLITEFSPGKFKEVCQNLYDQSCDGLEDDETPESLTETLDDCLAEADDCDLSEDKAYEISSPLWEGNDPPNFRVYTRQFYMFTEALKWFSTQLTSNRVVE